LISKDGHCPNAIWIDCRGNPRESLPSMRKYLERFGVYAAVFLIAILTWLVVVSRHGINLDKSSRAYVDQAIPAIAADWSDNRAFVSRLSPDFRAEVTDSQIDANFARMRVLGALKQYIGSKGMSHIAYNSYWSAVSLGAGLTTAEYKADVVFANGPAIFTIDLIKLRDDWRIQSFHVSSPLFQK
jgi:hypothetical protein